MLGPSMTIRIARPHGEMAFGGETFHYAKVIPGSRNSMSAASRRRNQPAPPEADAPQSRQEAAGGPIAPEVGETPFTVNERPQSASGRRSRRGAVPCPKCYSPFTSVVRVKPAKDSLRRVRYCTACKHTFQTREAVAMEKVTPVSPEVAALATGVASLAKLLESSPVLLSALQQFPPRTCP